MQSVNRHRTVLEYPAWRLSSAKQHSWTCEGVQSDVPFTNFVTHSFELGTEEFEALKWTEVYEEDKDHFSLILWWYCRIEFCTKHWLETLGNYRGTFLTALRTDTEDRRGLNLHTEEFTVSYFNVSHTFPLLIIAGMDPVFSVEAKRGKNFDLWEAGGMGEAYDFSKFPKKPPEIEKIGAWNWERFSRGRGGGSASPISTHELTKLLDSFGYTHFWLIRKWL